MATAEFSLRESTVPVTSHTCRHCGYLWVELASPPVDARIWHGICPRCRVMDQPEPQEADDHAA